MNLKNIFLLLLLTSVGSIAQNYNGYVAIYHGGIKEMLDSKEWDVMQNLEFENNIKGGISFDNNGIQFYVKNENLKTNISNFYPFESKPTNRNLLANLKIAAIPSFVVKDDIGNDFYIKFFAGLFDNDNVGIFVIPDIKNNRMFFLWIDNYIYDEILALYK